MRKTIVILAALVMALSFTQCKKQVAQITPAGGDGFHISLSVGNYSRVIVDPYNPGTQGSHQYAPVQFENGDLIYVGYNGECVGTLSCNNAEPQEYANFSGDLNITASQVVAGEHLYFYLLGGKEFTPEFNPNNTQATLNISDQTKRLPVVSYSVSEEEFSMDVHTYNAPRLMNKVSILKFRVTKPADVTENIIIEGMNNFVTLDFGGYNNTETNGFSYSKVDYGRIKMAGVAGGETEPVDMWVIVLPQDAITTTDKAFGEFRRCSGNRPAMPLIESNKYMSSGIDMTLKDLSFTAQMAAGQTTKKIYFAFGNLQYNPRNDEWRFAPNQWEYIGADNVHIKDGLSTENPANYYDGWIDLLGFGTWTWTSSEKVSYSSYSVPLILNYRQNASDYKFNLNDFTFEFDDDIAPWKTGGIDWKTMVTLDWDVVLNTRSNVSGVNEMRYAKAQVAGVNGLILFPDHYSHPSEVADVAKMNTETAAFTSNNYSEADWDKMEFAGAVFLPCGGYRYNTSCTPYSYSSVANPLGWYYSWNVAASPDQVDAKAMIVNASTITVNGSNDQKYYGRSVRLVHE